MAMMAGVPASSSRDDLLVEKIFALRTDKATGERMLHVKWKDRAHIHSSWVPTSLLESQPANKSRLQRFMRQRELEIADAEASGAAPEEGDYEYTGDELPYNAEWTVIERIIAERPSQARDTSGVEYLVKWSMLPYTACTWEHPNEIEISRARIAHFHRVNTPPRGIWRTQCDPCEGFHRPPASNWRKLEGSPLFRDGNALRPYQLEGVDWLLFSWYNRRSVLLADEMGLGKTVQSVAVLDHISRHERIRGPFIVVAPLSTLQHWQREVESWTGLNCVQYHGSAESRALIQQCEFPFFDIDADVDPAAAAALAGGKGGVIGGAKGRGKAGGAKGGGRGSVDSHLAGLYKFEVLVTTFEILHQDLDVLRRIRWRYLIVDEAHRMKNKDSALMHDLLSLDVQHCHLLTGTPLQNSTTELWSLLHFLDDKTFADLESFEREFGALTNAQQVAKLNAQIRPYLLRRQKNDVEKTLAPLEETIIWVEITLFQKKIYRAVLERNRDVLVRGTSNASVPSLINLQMELRKCCNHPFLIKGVEESETAELSRAEYLDRLVYASGKYVLLDKLLPRLRSDGHKVLIFSQMVRMLDMLEDFCKDRNYSFERLDGTIRGDARQMAIDRFSKTDVFVFLLSTRAGGLGINLTAADTCVIMDSDWNPQNDIQAMARSHRIGQKKTVKVFRLVTRNTYESQMVERANKKLGLERALNADRANDGLPGAAAAGSAVGAVGGAGRPGGPPADKAEIDLMLKQGAHDIFMDETGAAFEQFDAADIDQILESATHITHGADPTDEQASVFSKAAFVSDTSANADIDMADPEFWRKIMPELETAKDEDQAALLGMLEARKRRSVTIQREESLVTEAQRKLQKRALADQEKIHRKKLRDEAMKDAKNWPKVERVRCERALLSLGYGRWARIRKAAALEHRPIAAVCAFCRMWLYALLLPPQAGGADAAGGAGAATHAPPAAADGGADGAPAADDAADGGGSDARESPAALLGLVGAHLPAPSADELADMASLLTDSGFVDRLRRNRARLLGQLVSVRRLATSLNRCVSPLYDWQAPPLRGAPARDVAAWWTRRDDALLCVGAYVHGVRAIEQIRNDASLPFTTSLAMAGSGDDGGGVGGEGGGSGAGAADADDDDEDEGGGKDKDKARDDKEGGVPSAVLERRLKQLLDAVHEREYLIGLHEDRAALAAPPPATLLPRMPPLAAGDV